MTMSLKYQSAKKCSRCDKVCSTNKTGLCVDCRRVNCPICKKSFVPTKTNVCSRCNGARKLILKRYDCNVSIY